MFKTSLIVLLERFLARFTTKLITLSKSQFNDICHKYKISNEDKSTIIPLGIQVENFKDEKNEKRLSFRNKYKLNSNQLAIGIVGRIAPIKNHYLFIDSALLVLKDKVENIIFFIVGDGEETNSIKKYLNQQIKRVFGTEELINHFVFTSWHTEIEEVQNGLDIVVLTSSNEGTPLSLIEAQVCGKPVVVTNVGGVVDIVLDNETGFIVEKNCAIKLADKLLLLINNEDLRNKLGQKAKEFASESFSLQNQIEQTKDLYHKILEVEYK